MLLFFPWFDKDADLQQAAAWSSDAAGGEQPFSSTPMPTPSRVARATRRSHPQTRNPGMRPLAQRPGGPPWNPVAGRTEQRGQLTERFTKAIGGKDSRR